MKKKIHEDSIIIIKDNYNAPANKYLLYYNRQWDCWFFPHYRTEKDEDKNINNIKDGLSEWLPVSVSEIGLEHIGEMSEEKYSVNDKIDKIYNYRFYNADFAIFSDTIKRQSFVFANKKYIWMSAKEMKRDENIMKINHNIIQFIENI